MGSGREIEWKRTPYNVTMGQCDDYEGRVEFKGDYNQYECGLTVAAATAEDDGEWECYFESYVKGGSRGSGYKAADKFKVFVELPTTTTTTTTTVSTTTSTSTTTMQAVVVAREEEDYPENTEDLGTSGRLTGDEGEGSGGVVEESDNVVIIVVAICLIVIVLGLP